MSLRLPHRRLPHPRCRPRLSHQALTVALALTPVLTPAQRGRHHTAAEVALGGLVRVSGVLRVRPVEGTPRAWPLSVGRSVCVGGCVDRCEGICVFVYLWMYCYGVCME